MSEKKEDKTLLERALMQIDSRKGSYNGRENSFEFIARRWTLWLKNNFGIDVTIEPADVALLMAEFKLGRKEARKAAGAEVHPDDDEDAVAYLEWADRLKKYEQRSFIQPLITPQKVSDK